MDEQKQMSQVNEHYSSIARKLHVNKSTSCCEDDCCTGTSTMVASEQIPHDNPTSCCEADCCTDSIQNLQLTSLGSTKDLFVFADPQKGDIVVDLGSGPGSDVFKAAKAVGPTGLVIGVDFSDDMLALAIKNAKEGSFDNTEFRKGNLTDLPVESGTVDLVISNCVINLVPDKEKVLAEAYRILKPGGRFIISDMVALSEFSEEFKNDSGSLCGCVSGASSEEVYERILTEKGFVNIEIIRESNKKHEWQGGIVEYGSSILKAYKAG